MDAELSRQGPTNDSHGPVPIGRSRTACPGSSVQSGKRVGSDPEILLAVDFVAGRPGSTAVAKDKVQRCNLNVAIVGLADLGLEAFPAVRLTAVDASDSIEKGRLDGSDALGREVVGHVETVSEEDLCNLGVTPRPRLP